MNDIKKEDVKQEVLDLYDDYAHNRINRREFVQKLSIYAVGGLTVASLMSFLMLAAYRMEWRGLCSNSYIKPGSVF